MFEENSRCLSEEEWQIIHGDKEFPKEYKEFWDSIPSEQLQEFLPTDERKKKLKKFYDVHPDPVTENEIENMFDWESKREEMLRRINQLHQPIGIMQQKMTPYETWKITYTGVMKRAETLKKKAKLLESKDPNEITEEEIIDFAFEYKSLLEHLWSILDHLMFAISKEFGSTSNMTEIKMFNSKSLFEGGDKENKQHFEDTRKSSAKKIEKWLETVLGKKYGELQDFQKTKLIYMMFLANPIQFKNSDGKSNTEFLHNIKYGRNLHDLHFSRNYAAHRELILPHIGDDPILKSLKLVIPIPKVYYKDENKTLEDDNISEANISQLIYDFQYGTKSSICKKPEDSKQFESTQKWLLNESPYELFGELKTSLICELYYDNFPRFIRSKYAKDDKVMIPKVSLQFPHKDEDFYQPIITDYDLEL
eukprot:gene2104-1971_t